MLMITVGGNAGPSCHGWRGAGGGWIAAIRRVEIYCTRLAIVIWPSLLPALSFQVECCVTCVSIRWSHCPRGVITERDITLLINNRGGIPLCGIWWPPRHRGALRTNGVSSSVSQAGENDQTNVATKRSFQAFSTYPTLRRSRRRRIAPSVPSLHQPSRQFLAACPERPNSSKTFTNLNNSLNSEPKE